jgi:hypothetical protein
MPRARYPESAKRVAAFRTAVNPSFAEFRLKKEVSAFHGVKRRSEDEEVPQLPGDAKLAVICGVCFAGG